MLGSAKRHQAPERSELRRMGGKKGLGYISNRSHAASTLAHERIALGRTQPHHPLSKCTPFQSNYLQIKDTHQHTMMVSSCESCDRRFNTMRALQQHIRCSPAHSNAFACEECNRTFRTEQALQQHIRTSPAHSTTAACEDCDRTFDTAQALQQHIRDSPAHANGGSAEEAVPSPRQHSPDLPACATSFACEDCDRVFKTEQALQQHNRDSPAHANGSSSEEVVPSLQQHSPESPAHTTAFACEVCDRTFNTEQALQQHIRDSPAHANDGSAEDEEKDTPSFDMRPSLHGDVARLLDQYGLILHFAPIDDPHDFLKDYDTNIMGAFTCTNDSCRKRGWTSKIIAITIREVSHLRYNARVYYQRCESCGSLARPRLDDSYAQRVAYRLAKWSGIALPKPHYSGRSDRPHQERLCEGCRHGRCLVKQNSAASMVEFDAV